MKGRRENKTKMNGINICCRKLLTASLCASLIPILLGRKGIKAMIREENLARTTLNRSLTFC